MKILRRSTFYRKLIVLKNTSFPYPFSMLLYRSICTTETFNMLTQKYGFQMNYFNNLSLSEMSRDRSPKVEHACTHHTGEGRRKTWWTKARHMITLDTDDIAVFTQLRSFIRERRGREDDLPRGKWKRVVGGPEEPQELDVAGHRHLWTRTRLYQTMNEFRQFKL